MALLIMDRDSYEYFKMSVNDFLNDICDSWVDDSDSLTMSVRAKFVQLKIDLPNSGPFEMFSLIKEASPSGEVNFSLESYAFEKISGSIIKNKK